MYDYTLQLQARQRIEDLRRETQRRHWLRTLMSGQKTDRHTDKSEPVRETAHSQYE